MPRQTNPANAQTTVYHGNPAEIEAAIRARKVNRGLQMKRRLKSRKF